MRKETKERTGGQVGARGEELLLGWVVGEVYALRDVALQALYTGLKEGLLVVVEVGEWVDGLLGSRCLVRVSV